MAGLFGITSTGKKTSIYRSSKGSQVGVKDANTGKIFPHPRGTLNGGLTSSKSVKITNPKALDSFQTREANRSKINKLGQGGV